MVNAMVKTVAVMCLMIWLIPPVSAEMSWQPGTPMLSPRTGPAATVGADGLIYGIGGVDAGVGHGHATNSVERYDESTDTWSYVAPMAKKRIHAGAVTDSRGRIYAAGGYDETSAGHDTVERYDPTTNTWTTMTSTMNDSRGQFGMVIASDDRIYALGGEAEGYSHTFRGLKSVERYDPLTDTWSYVADMHEHRFDVPAATDAQGRIYAIGGATEINGSFQVVSSVERYDPVLDQWEYVAPLPEIRSGGSAFTLNGEIYLVGGGNGPTYFHTDCFIYSPDTDTWRTGPSMYDATNHTASVVGPSGIAYLLGGEGPSVRAYDRVATLVVPAPAAVVLGAMGLGSVGVFRRRWSA